MRIGLVQEPRFDEGRVHVPERPSILAIQTTVDFGKGVSPAEDGYRKKIGIPVGIHEQRLAST